MGLWEDIQAELSGLPGTVGLWWEDLADGETLSLNPDEPFPGASVIKVPLLVEIARLGHTGLLDLQQRVHLPLQEARFRTEDSSGILTHLKSPVWLSIEDLAVLMIIESDNLATNLLYELAPQANPTLAALGLQRTRLTHPIVNFVELRSDEANPITAREMAQLYRQIYRRELPGSAWMFDILKEQHSETLIPALLRDEPDLVIAHKTGGVKGVLHDTGLVLGPGFGYVLCLLTKGGAAQVPAIQALNRVSWRVYEYARGKRPHPPPLSR